MGDDQVVARVMFTESLSVETARWALMDAIYRSATAAAKFEAQANNYDRPIAETPWLAAYRYGNGEYDARWYAVMSAKDHMHARAYGDIENELNSLIAAAYLEGLNHHD